MIVPSPPVRILGVRLDFGQSRRGVDMGPSAIRLAGLGQQLEALGYKVDDIGDIAAGMIETRAMGNRQARYMTEIAKVCGRTANRLSAILELGALPVTLGGDHSIAVGTLSGASRFFRSRGERLGLIWLDAHCDINTPETTPSGNVHGMPLAFAMGLGQGALAHVVENPPLMAAENCVLVGIREVDAGERRHLRELGLQVFTMRDIDEQGMTRVMSQAVELASGGTAGFHVSLDMDFLDPLEAPGVGTPSPGGVTYREAHLAMEIISDSGGMRSLDIVEVNPILDVRNSTAELAVGLAASAFGKRIL